MRYRSFFMIALLLVLPACDRDEEAPAAGVTEQQTADLTGVGYERLAAEDLERGRLDPGWRQVAEIEPFEGDTTRAEEEWDDISADAVNRQATNLPVRGDVAGPSVLSVQILLDRALFSPGIMDGRWGKNSEKAIYWFQQREGLRRTGVVDQETFERLAQAAGSPRELVRTHTLTEEDVAGPFKEIPDDIYDKAEMDCMCYESLEEKLSETFHATPELLSKLNPNVDLNAVSAGSTLRVPNVREADAGRGAAVDRIVISAAGHYLHALDAEDRIVYHFPTTMGSSYDPSPSGDHRITSITEDPWWHYQPDILEHVDDSKPDARIPPGPNNAVGLVWMALSIPHYGIHGTAAPETIGYTTSAGCVRLTNWDAIFLADRVASGTDVEFRES